MRCQYCNSPISEGRKYCNRSCSGKASVGNARKSLAEKTKNDPDWHSRRSQELWKDSEYIEKVRSKTFDNPEWKKKYQSLDNQKYAIVGYKKKLETDEDFLKQETEKRLAYGFGVQFKDPDSNLRKAIIKSNKEREWSPEIRERLSKRAVEKNQDVNDFFGTNRGKWTIYNNVHFRSSWEASFASSLDSLNIKWEYESTTFVINKKRYTPDFYLPEHQIYVEIKANYFVTEEVHQRLRSFPHTIILVTEDNWQEFLQNIHD